MIESQSVISPANHKSMSNQVQEIATDCDKLPERFIRKEDEEYGNITNPSPAEIPVIDVSLLTSSSHLELGRLKSAITTWGCFQAINHGIEGSLLDKVREISKLFFSLSAEEKKKCLREEDDVEGYGNDMVLSDHQTLDWTDRVYLTVLPKHQQRLQFWPQNPNNFREVVDEYCSKIELINEIILKSLARSLNLEENCFLDQYGPTANMFARFNYYPPCPWADKVLGLKPHSDGSATTYLLQDKELEGLQILKDGQWFGVPIVPDALTINVGEQIEIMSNGIFKSPVHRALVNSKDQRISVAMFCNPQTEKDIGPVDALVTDDRPRRYKNIDSGLPLVIMMEGSTNGHHHHHHPPPHHHHHHRHNFNRGAFVYRAPRHSYNVQHAQRNLGQHSHGKTNPPFKVGHKSESRSGYTERREKASRKQERIRSNRLVIDVVSGDSTKIMCGLCSASTSDNSVVAVLVCGHVYHADCLETRTPYEERRDPLCPVCVDSHSAN
ncbi:hypothetical protein E3N88_35830 [Mikania micrantha]|uniref:Fe2OG dioxygenase domain-containing protein n=1 Tax=Mikania micrantha TaxID=192012 RepID=A0A5N6M204_9ASTR|nr:hypothetical protein E3N88_35830 [Mikania micrantha]